MVGRGGVLAQLGLRASLRLLRHLAGQEGSLVRLSAAPLGLVRASAHAAASCHLLVYLHFFPGVGPESPVVGHRRLAALVAGDVCCPLLELPRRAARDALRRLVHAPLPAVRVAPLRPVRPLLKEEGGLRLVAAGADDLQLSDDGTYLLVPL